MKKLTIILLVIASLGLMSSCKMDDEAYSLNKAWVGFGIVTKDSSSDVLRFTMDNKDVLYPIANAVNIKNLDDNDRVWLNFTILGDKKNEDDSDHYYVKINSFRKILFKEIFDITSEKEDSIGNNSIGIEDKWIKNGILNFKLYYYGGTKTHFINLVKAPGAIDPNKPVELELRHNNNGDTGQIPFSTYVSFDLSKIRVEGQTSTPFKITAKGFGNKTFEYSGDYKY